MNRPTQTRVPATIRGLVVSVVRPEQAERITKLVEDILDSTEELPAP